MKYITFSKNKFSQNGEDGILNKIFEELDHICDKKKICVEFGSWDGIYLSNTFQFVEKGWDAIAIEGSKKRYKKLLNTSEKYKNIKPIMKFVDSTSNSANSLKKILEDEGIKDDYELLSIDVDGLDLDIWDSYSGSPKVVVIEINSHIPPNFVQRHNGKNKIGSSFKATLMVAQKKGYTLICHTGNMIFVRNDCLQYLDMDKEDIENPENLFNKKWLNIKERKNLISIFYSYIKKIFDI